MKKKQRSEYGSVYKVKGRTKPYRAMVTTGYKEDGKAIRKSLGYFKTEQEGWNALLKYAGNPNLINDGITISEVFKMWSEEVYPFLSQSSIRKYNSVMNKHLEPIANMKMADVRFHNLHLLLENKTYPVQYDIKTTLSSLYKWAIPREIVSTNLAASLKLKSKVKAKKVNRTVFTTEEIQYLWDNVDTIPMADFILVLLYTGMRIDELLKMETKNVFLKENYMIGGNKKYDKDTKELIQRIIPIHPDIKSLIKKRQNIKKYLFTTERGKPIEYSNFLKTYWQPLTDHYCHDTRHTFISRMVELEAHPIYLRLIVGHSLKGVTEKVYTHVATSSLYNEIRKLDYGVNF